MLGTSIFWNTHMKGTWEEVSNKALQWALENIHEHTHAPTSHHHHHHHQNDLPHGAKTCRFLGFQVVTFATPWNTARLLGAYCLWRASVKSWPFFAATTWERSQCMGTTMLHRHPKRKKLLIRIPNFWGGMLVSQTSIKFMIYFMASSETSRSNKSACPGSFNESIIIGDLAVLYMCITNAKRHYVYKNLHYLRMWYMQITIHLYTYIYTHLHMNTYIHIS